MVSKFRYDTIPKVSLKEIKLHPVKSIILLIAVTLIIITKGEGLFAFSLFYISTGIFRGVKNYIRKHLFGKHEALSEEELGFKEK